MKNQYFGDINDYRKYGLLRVLRDATRLPGEVCWMLTKDDGGPDGRKIDYLESPERWASFDLELYSFLREVVRRGERSVRAIERSDVLSGYGFQSGILTDDAVERAAYLDDLFAATSSGRLLFFDPDNGMEVQSVRPGRKNSSKYLYWSEAEAAYTRGNSLLVYQHYPRKSRLELEHSLALEFCIRLGAGRVMTLSTGNVLFLLIPHSDHEQKMTKVEALLEERWADQFTAKWHSPLEPVATVRRTGREAIMLAGGRIARLEHFWQWASSGILGNTTRGIFAEYLVALALGVADEVANEWAPYDVTSPSGIKVEVKCSGYIQSWFQKSPSRISFAIGPKHAWIPETDTYSEARRRWADVYVFCLLAEKQQDRVDPLIVDQWEFYVLPTRVLDELGDQSTIGLARLVELGAVPVGFGDLEAAVEKAGRDDEVVIKNVNTGELS